MKALVAVSMLVLTSCSNLPAKPLSDYSSHIKVAVVHHAGAKDAYLEVANGSASSVGVVVPLFVFSKSRYSKCGTGPIEVEGHLRKVPPSGKTDIPLGGLFQSNHYVGIFVYADGSSDQGDHCLVWSENRMS